MPTVQPKVAVLHAHGFDGFFETHVNLGVLTRAVCESFLLRQAEYDYVVLPGGHHDELFQARPTSGELMERFLLERDVPKEKIVTQFSHGAWVLQPPADTIMEADLTGYLFQNMFPEMRPQEVAFDAFSVWFHIPRCAAIWRYRGANLQNCISAFSLEMLFLSMWKRIAQEPPGMIVNCFDPLGESWFFKRLRAKRIHQGSGDFIPLTSAAWFPTLAFMRAVVPSE